MDRSRDWPYPSPNGATGLASQAASAPSPLEVTLTPVHTQLTFAAGQFVFLALGGSATIRYGSPAESA